MQLSGQSKDHPDSGKETGGDHRFRHFPRRYLPFSSYYIRREGGYLWGRAADHTRDKGKKSRWNSELYGGDVGVIKVNSVVKLNMPKIKQLSQAQVAALEKTAEAVHTEVVQAQVFPFDTGNLQNESTFVDYSQSKAGTATLVSSTPYARRLYYHPEYHFHKDENPNAKGHWYEDWEPGGSKQDFAPEAFKRFYKREAGL